MWEPILIWHIARYEAKLLFRSWAFRIFSLLGLAILISMNIGIGTKVGGAPHFFISMSGALPLANIKLLNIYQGIIAVFLATEFLKRDRKFDTSQVFNTRSFSNTSYIIGKLIGILFVFTVLNILILLQVFLIHYFFSPTVFAWQPYFLYPIFIGLPTLSFVVGLSFILVKLVRSQAVVFVILLAYSLLTLIFIGNKQFYIFDVFAFYQPLTYSDFIGMGNLSDLIQIRGGYFLMGISMVGVSILLNNRLRQSFISNNLIFVLSVLFFSISIYSGYDYLNRKYEDASYRKELIKIGENTGEYPTISIIKSDINLKHAGKIIEALVNISAVNNRSVAIDSILLTLNPGLNISSVKSGNQDLQFRRDHYLLWIKADKAINPRDSINLSIDYNGTIDDRYCYLDIEPDRYNSSFSFYLYTVPKLYSIVLPDYLHLTPESGWYPIAGLPQGVSFPRPVNHDYSSYSLTIELPYGMSAISQGSHTIDTIGENFLYKYSPRIPLPNLSLTIGNYETISIEVDSVEYSLNYLPGHGYFYEYFDELNGTLPDLIRELKNEYEVVLGLEYPYDRLILVETPIQFYSYQRLWTMGQEMVQPQIVYLPEMGTICSGTDFRRMKRDAKRSQERANQEDKPEIIQAGYFRNFANFDLLGMKTNPRGISREENIDPEFKILPNYLSFNSYVSSRQCPILNYSLESYFYDRITPALDNRWRYWRGLTDIEKANLALKEMSLVDLISSKTIEPEIKTTGLNSKGRSLWAQMETQVGEEQFIKTINEFIREKKYQVIEDFDICSLMNSLGDFDFSATLERWYKDTVLPGFIVENLENYKVMDGERTRSQLKFSITNPTSIDGLVELSVRSRAGRTDFGPWYMRRQNQDNYSQNILIPAMTTKYVGVLLDDPPSEVNIDTYVSENLPSSIRGTFRDEKLKKNEVAFSGEEIKPVESDDDDTTTIIVDNEDSGFQIVTDIKENWFRVFLMNLIGIDEDEDTYVGMRVWDPPGTWLATTDEDYYGKFVRSAEYKRSGDGVSKVAWVADLDYAGDYDVYYYCLGENMPVPWRRRRGGQRSAPKGKKHIMVHHDDGIENVVIDLGTAEEGWTYLGTFRLSQGDNRVELSDETENDIVVADAVKWVRR